MPLELTSIADFRARKSKWIVIRQPEFFDLDLVFFAPHRYCRPAKLEVAPVEQRLADR